MIITGVEVAQKQFDKNFPMSLTTKASSKSVDKLYKIFIKQYTVYVYSNTSSIRRTML